MFRPLIQWARGDAVKTITSATSLGRAETAHRKAVADVIFVIFRRALRDAVGHSQAKMPRFDLRKAAVRYLQGDLSPDPGDLRRIYAAHRAVIARRGVSR